MQFPLFSLSIAGPTRRKKTMQIPIDSYDFFSCEEKTGDCSNIRDTAKYIYHWNVPKLTDKILQKKKGDVKNHIMSDMKITIKKNYTCKQNQCPYKSKTSETGKLYDTRKSTKQHRCTRHTKLQWKFTIFSKINC